MWPSLPGFDDPDFSDGEPVIENSMPAPQPPAPKRRRMLGKTPTNEDMNPVLGDWSIQSFFHRIMSVSKEACAGTEKAVVKGGGTIIDDINHQLDQINPIMSSGSQPQS